MNRSLPERESLICRPHRKWRKWGIEVQHSFQHSHDNPRELFFIIMRMFNDYSASEMGYLDVVLVRFKTEQKITKLLYIRYTNNLKVTN